MDLGLQGKTVLVTGGSRGIGQAITRMFAAEKANVAICARGQAGIDTLVTEIKEQGVQAFGQVADITHPEDVEDFIAASAEALGGIDILINNAGGSKGKRFEDTTDQNWFDTFDLNIFHAVRASRAAIPYMRQRGGGSIIIISSISGYKPSPSLPYGCAKAAEIFLAPSLAMELGPDKIRVNTLCPGSILFPGGGWERRQERDPEGFGHFQVEEFPLGRLGTAEEIARAVVFVASSAGSWINGAMIPVDGGQQQPSMYQKGPAWR